VGSQGEVLLVTLPNGRRRPAVVVSSNWFNGSRDELVVAAVTSRRPAQPDRDDVPLLATEAGLPADATLKAGKLITIQQSQVGKSLGKLPDKTLHVVLERVSEMLGLL